MTDTDKTMEAAIGKGSPKLSRASLLSLPEELFYGYIFSQLEYADLLRLRRACEPIKIYADAFIRNNFKSQVVREINETNYTLQQFLQVNLPTTSIFINNSSPAFFEDPLIREFLLLYGDLITHVRIHHFGTFISEPELHFFSSLPNLLHLDVDFIDATKRDCFSTSKDAEGLEVRCIQSPFPPNLKKIKTLKLNEIQGSRKDDIFYGWDFINFCENLEYVKHPLHKVKDPFERDHPSGQLGCLMNYVKRRRENNPDQPNLRFCDLEHYNDGNDRNDNRMPWLAIFCEVHGVKLLNVNSNLLHTGGNPRHGATPAVLVSLRNVEGEAFRTELPNLEKLVVESTEKSSFGETWETEYIIGIGLVELGMVVEPPQWPKLRILDLKIDSRLMFGAMDVPFREVENFFDFLFEPASGKPRENVKELALRFDLDKLFIKCIGHVPIPNVRDVTAACPFVTKLTLEGWVGTNKQVSLFWRGLPLLEEVVLEKCIKLGDVAFVGKDKEDPVFLKLRHLKKLSLKRIDLTHKITDLAFDLVFRHLKVKQFCLTSAKPIQCITAAGIESLLTGNFNKSVEKFPFDGWSLDGVSDEAFLELKMKFRATHMI